MVVAAIEVEEAVGVEVARTTYVDSGVTTARCERWAVQASEGVNASGGFVAFIVHTSLANNTSARAALALTQTAATITDLSAATKGDKPLRAPKRLFFPLPAAPVDSAFIAFAFDDDFEEVLRDFCARTLCARFAFRKEARSEVCW